MMFDPSSGLGSSSVLKLRISSNFPSSSRRALASEDDSIVLTASSLIWLGQLLISEPNKAR